MSLLAFGEPTFTMPHQHCNTYRSEACTSVRVRRQWDMEVCCTRLWVFSTSSRLLLTVEFSFDRDQPCAHSSPTIDSINRLSHISYSLALASFHLLTSLRLALVRLRLKSSLVAQLEDGQFYQRNTATTATTAILLITHHFFLHNIDTTEVQ